MIVVGKEYAVDAVMLLYMIAKAMKFIKSVHFAELWLLLPRRKQEKERRKEPRIIMKSMQCTILECAIFMVHITSHKIILRH